jgi:F-type H+-transporting ATPase subunit g
MYRLSVAREVLKQIYIAEGLQPPMSLSAIQSAYATLWTRASSLAYWRQIASNGELGKVAIYAVEAYGIFKVSQALVSARGC